MAVVAVANDSVRQHDMGDTDGVTGVAGLGGGAGPGIEPDFIFQGSNSVSRKIGTTLAGFDVNGVAAAANMTAANRPLWLAKLIATNKDALIAIGSPALEVRIGSTNADYYTLDISGNESEFYPPKGGWLLVAINPNLAAFQGAVTGTPALTAVDYWAIRGDFSATSKGENLAMDAIDVGIGLTLVGGDGADADGVIQDFVDDDQGTQTAGRFGFFTVLDGIVSVLGMHSIGTTVSTTTATVFNDSNVIIVFPDGLFGSGDCGFTFDLGNATTDIDLTSFIMTGVGRRNRPRFDTETDVDGTNDEITLQSVIDSFRPGDAVIARSQSGTETPGITNGTRYWIGKDLAAAPTGLTLHTSRNDALLESGSPGSGTPVVLTASTAGNGEIWRIDKDNDTRPQLVATGTSGVLDITGGTYTQISLFALTSTCALIGATINGARGIIQSGARIEGNIFNRHETIEAELFIAVSDIADIVDNIFDNTGGRGHAIRSLQTGSIGFVGNTFTGYFAVTDQTLHQFDNTTDVDAAADGITLPAGHGYVTGDAIVYSRMLTANTAVGGLTEGVTYYLGLITGNQFSLHLNEGDAINDNARIALTVGSGNETHALWPANAAFLNFSGGALTLSVSGGGTTPSVRNSLDSTTVIQNAVTLSVQVDDPSGNPVDGARVRIERVSDGSLVSNGTTNASGLYSDSTFNFTSNLDVTTKVRLKGFRNFRTGGTITANGLSVGVTFQPDPIVDLP